MFRFSGTPPLGKGRCPEGGGDGNVNYYCCMNNNNPTDYSGLIRRGGALFYTHESAIANSRASEALRFMH